MTKSRTLANTIGQEQALKVPSGTTAQRPNASNGYFRFNTTTSSFEGYSGSSWGSIGGSGSSSGYLANSIIYANTTGYLSNTSGLYYDAPNTAIVSPVVQASSPFFINSNTATQNTTIPSGYNSLSAGPVSVANNITITIANNAVWSIV